MTQALLDDFSNTVKTNGSKPILALFPNKDDVRLYQKEGKTSYQPILDSLKNVCFVDFLDVFEKQDKKLSLDELFMPGGHYTPRGYALVANELNRLVTHLNEKCPSL